MNVFRQELYDKLRFGMEIIEQTWILFDRAFLTQDEIPMTIDNGQFVPMILRTNQADYFIRLDILQNVPEIDYIHFLSPSVAEFYDISSPLLMFGNLRDIYMIPFIYFLESAQTLLEYLDNFSELFEEDRDIIASSVLDTAHELNQTLAMQLAYLRQNIHFLHRINSFLTDRADEIAETMEEIESVFDVTERHLQHQDEDANLQNSVQNVMTRNQQTDVSNLQTYNQSVVQNMDQAENFPLRPQLRRGSLRDGRFLQDVFRDNVQIGRQNSELRNIEDESHNLRN